MPGAADAADGGWPAWSAVERVAGRVAAAAVTLGFVALGAGVLASRVLFDVMEHGWNRVSGADDGAMPPPGRPHRPAADPR